MLFSIVVVVDDLIPGDDNNNGKCHVYSFLWCTIISKMLFAKAMGDTKQWQLFCVVVVVVVVR